MIVGDGIAMLNFELMAFVLVIQNGADYYWLVKGPQHGAVLGSHVFSSWVVVWTSESYSMLQALALRVAKFELLLRSLTLSVTEKGGRDNRRRGAGNASVIQAEGSKLRAAGV